MHFDKKTLRNIFLGVAACIFLYWILHETEQFKSFFSVVKGVFAPFVFGSGLAFILNVPMRSIENKLLCIKNMGLRRVVAVLLTIVIVMLVLALVLYLLIPQVIATATNLIAKLPDFFNESREMLITFLEEHPKMLEWVQNNTNFESINYGQLIQNVLNMAGDRLSGIFTSAFSAIGGFARGIVNFVIGFVFALYCLFSKETLARQGRKLLYAFLPEVWSDNTVRILRLTNSTFSNFLSGQCLEVCILGCLFAISMAIFRMPYIPLVSVLVAVTAFIPVVGAFVGCFFGAFFILVDNPIQAVGFVVMFLILQQIENNLIYPRVVGTSIGLPGMWVLLAVAIGGELMGVAGMFLMIPLASVLYTLTREIAQTNLQNRNIDATKLEPQPPELRSHFKEKREHVRKKRIAERLKRAMNRSNKNK